MAFNKDSTGESGEFEFGVRVDVIKGLISLCRLFVWYGVAMAKLEVPETVVLAVAKAMEPEIFSPIRYKWSGSHVARINRLRAEEMYKARRAIKAYRKAIHKALR